jgi:epoxide hydrolase-like predicted phosphatase
VRNEAGVTRIKAAIFDIGNVLVPFDWQVAERQFQSRIGNKTKEARDKFLVLKECFELGQIPQELFLREAIRIIDFRGGPDEFTTIWNGIFSSNEVMEECIVQLRNSVPLYLLSNTSELHLSFLKERFRVLRHFADGVYSCRVECAKPDRKIFEIAVKQFEVTPSRTIYVDDLESNIRSAAELGFHAIQYDWNRHSEFKQRLGEFGLP